MMSHIYAFMRRHPRLAAHLDPIYYRCQVWRRGKAVDIVGLGQTKELKIGAWEPQQRDESNQPKGNTDGNREYSSANP